jgi:hypothetical protein
MALARWGAFEATPAHETREGERRFRRRAFERARDKALIALAMTTGGARGHRGGRLAA